MDKITKISVEIYLNLFDDGKITQEFVLFALKV